jgi:hypothetical protein
MALQDKQEAMATAQRELQDKAAQELSCRERLRLEDELPIAEKE